MGEQSRRLVEDKLNWDKITNQYINVYEGLVAGAAGKWIKPEKIRS